MKLKILLATGLTALFYGTSLQAATEIEINGEQGVYLPYSSADSSGAGLFQGGNDKNSSAGALTYTLNVANAGEYILYINTGNKTPGAGTINNPGHIFHVYVNATEDDGGTEYTYGPYNDAGGNWDGHILVGKRITLPEGKVTVKIANEADGKRWYLNEKEFPYLVPDTSYDLGRHVQEGCTIDVLHPAFDSETNFTRVIVDGKAVGDDKTVLLSPKASGRNGNSWSTFPASKLHYPIRVSHSALYPVEIKGKFYDRTGTAVAIPRFPISFESKFENSVQIVSDFLPAEDGTYVATGLIELEDGFSVAMEDDTDPESYHLKVYVDPNGNYDDMVLPENWADNYIFMLSDLSIGAPIEVLFNDPSGKEYLVEDAPHTFTGKYYLDDDDIESFIIKQQYCETKDGDKTPFGEEVILKPYSDDVSENYYKADDETFSFTFASDEPLEEGYYTFTAVVTNGDDETSESEITVRLVNKDHMYSVLYVVVEDGAGTVSAEGDEEDDVIDKGNGKILVLRTKNVNLTFTPTGGNEFLNATLNEFPLEVQFNDETGVGTCVIDNVTDDANLVVNFGTKSFNIEANGNEGGCFIKVYRYEDGKAVGQPFINTQNKPDKTDVVDITMGRTYLGSDVIVYLEGKRGWHYIKDLVITKRNYDGETPSKSVIEGDAIYDMSDNDEDSKELERLPDGTRVYVIRNVDSPIYIDAIFDREYYDVNITYSINNYKNDDVLEDDAPIVDNGKGSEETDTDIEGVDLQESENTAHPHYPRKYIKQTLSKVTAETIDDTVDDSQGGDWNGSDARWRFDVDQVRYASFVNYMMTPELGFKVKDWAVYDGEEKQTYDDPSTNLYEEDHVIMGKRASIKGLKDVPRANVEFIRYAWVVEVDPRFEGGSDEGRNIIITRSGTENPDFPSDKYHPMSSEGFRNIKQYRTDDRPIHGVLTDANDDYLEDVTIKVTTRHGAIGDIGNGWMIYNVTVTGRIQLRNEDDEIDMQNDDEMPYIDVVDYALPITYNSNYTEAYATIKKVDGNLIVNAEYGIWTGVPEVNVSHDKVVSEKDGVRIVVETSSQVVITDMTGKVLYSGTVVGEELISLDATGLILVHVSNEKNAKTTKIIK